MQKGVCLAICTDYLTRKQVANRWGVSLTTVDRMILRGQLKSIRFGKAVRITVASVEAYEKACV